jgi:hypothetical protein
MDKVGSPRGLIRYDSEKGITEGRRNIFNPRSLAYSAVLTVLLVIVGTSFVFRTDFETTILRQHGTLFQEYGEESYSNIYQIEIVNKTRKQHDVEIRLLDPVGKIVMMGDPLVVEEGDSGSGTFLTVIAKDELRSSNTRLRFGVFSGENLIEEYEATFVGPNSLDKQ